LSLESGLGNLESQRKHKTDQANLRPMDPPMSHKNRLAVALVNK
jgi:hypothetical protein